MNLYPLPALTGAALLLGLAACSQQEPNPNSERVLKDLAVQELKEAKDIAEKAKQEAGQAKKDAQEALGKDEVLEKELDEAAKKKAGELRDEMQASPDTSTQTQDSGGMQ